MEPEIDLLVLFDTRYFCHDTWCMKCIQISSDNKICKLRKYTHKCSEITCVHFGERKKIEQK